MMTTMKRWALVATAAFVFPLIALAAARWHVIGEIEEQDARNAYLDGQIAPLDAELGGLEKLSQLTEELLSRLVVIRELSGGSGEAIALMSDLSLIPQGVALERVTVEGSELSIRGEAMSPRHVSALLRSLTMSPRLSEPRLLSTKPMRGAAGRLISINARIVTPPAPGDGER